MLDPDNPIINSERKLPAPPPVPEEFRRIDIVIGEAGNHHFMDKTDHNKEHIEDSARESLIAISYRLPDGDLSVEIPPKFTNGEKTGEQPQVRDGEDNCRAELISISSSPAADVKVLPLPVDLDG